MLGQTLLHYEITAKLGQGGMGEVYQATDTKLDREVAIKVLPPAFAQDRVRLARFEREAKVLAQLSHTHIASVHGFDQHEGTAFLVMEHVSGEDLSQRLKRGPLPVDEAIEIGRQIAEGLEAAHVKGIIHRDLKPANIKLDSEGNIKVLDFGLAKATVASAVPNELGAAQATGIDSDSPTLTAEFTQPGAVLGTAAYMSPEQARGKTLDQRTDIWAFGCVLFECLTGERPFSGENTADTLAAVMRSEPDWSRLPKDLSPLLRRLLVKCLSKDPRSRLQHIGDGRLELTELANDSSVHLVSAESSCGTGFNHKSSLKMPAVMVAMVLVAIIAAVLSWTLKPLPIAPDPRVRTVSVDLGVEGSLYYSDDSLRLNRDGTAMAFLFSEADGGGGSKLFLREFDRINPREIPEAEDAREFCFSPEGDWIAFLSRKSDRLLKVSLAGEGAVVPLSDVIDESEGMDWTSDGWILSTAGRGTKLIRIPENGGAAELLFETDSSQEEIFQPRAFPEGQGWLFSVSGVGREGRSARIMAQKGPGTLPVTILEEAKAARFVPPDYLFYERNETLFVQRFDLSTLSVKGGEVSVGVNLGHQSFFDIADDGTLVYTQLGRQFGQMELMWLSRQGIRQSLKQMINGNDHFDMLPQGDNVAYVEREFPADGDFELWVHDIANGTRRLLTSSPEKMPSLLWSPDGDAVVFGSSGEGKFRIYRAQADGSGQVQSLVQGPNRLAPYSWHPTERKLLYGEYVPGVKGKVELWVATFSGTDSREWDLLRKEHYTDITPRESGDASFSPDGKSIVYSSQEAGIGHLFINQYPELRAPMKITFEGFDSYSPQWWADQHELVFLRREAMGSRLHHVYVAKYREIDGGYQFDRPQPWERGLVQRGTFSIDPKGHRLLVGQYASLIDHFVLHENIVTVAERKLKAQ